jgi:hypothetical protein
MTIHLINFIFDASVDMTEVDNTLSLARVAVESIHGQDRVTLEMHATVDPPLRSCQIDTSLDLGRTLAVVFAGFVRREFGDDVVRVQRITTHLDHPTGGDQ